MFRPKRARIVAGGVAVAAAALLIAGCSSSSSSSTGSGTSSSSAPAASGSAPTGSTRMGIFYYNPSPYGIASLKGAQAQAAKLGVQLDAFDANNNPQL